MENFKDSNHEEMEDSLPKTKKSSKTMKKVMKVVAGVTATVALFASAFGIAGAISNKKADEENLVKLSQIEYSLEENSHALAQQTVEKYKKETFEREIIKNNKYFYNTNFNLGEDFFYFLNREEFRGLNSFYNIIEYKNLTVYINPSMPYEHKFLVREAVNYLNNVFHAIDSNINIKETDTLKHESTCIHIKDNDDFKDSTDSKVGETFLYFDDDPRYNDAINIEIYLNQISSYKHNDEYFKIQYKAIVMHELCHALGITHIPEMTDDAGRFRTGVVFNELNRPLMSRAVGSVPNDRLSAKEIAGLFGLINRNEYAELNSKADKTEYQKRLNEDFQKYLQLVKYSLDQSRGYMLNMAGSKIDFERNQVVELYYRDRVYDDDKQTSVDRDVFLTLNCPYANYYQKKVIYEDGYEHTFFAPYFLNVDNEGNYKFSLMSENLKSFDNCNVFIDGNSSTLVADNLKVSEIEQKIKEIDPNCGYYVVESGAEDEKYVYTTQNFWQKFFNKHQDNYIYYDVPLFALYKTSPKWKIQTFNYNTISAIELTNDIDLKSFSDESELER